MALLWSPSLPLIPPPSSTVLELIHTKARHTEGLRKEQGSAYWTQTAEDSRAAGRPDVQAEFCSRTLCFCLTASGRNAGAVS